MEEKYYTPEIGDVRIGYEIEMINNYVKNETWEKYICDKNLLFLIYSFYEHQTEIEIDKFSNNFRTAYLTKEQIEKEGWLCVNNVELSFQKMLDNNTWWEIDYDVELHNLIIEYWKYNSVTDKSDGFTKFQGECKDINTFRQICKWLKI